MNTAQRTDVDLVVPATTAYLRYLRVAAATMGDDAGFDVTRIESLRLAIDEVCAIAIDIAAETATLRVTLGFTDDGIHIAGTCEPVIEEPLVDPISTQLLDSFTSGYEITRDGDACRFSLRCSN